MFSINSLGNSDISVNNTPKQNNPIGARLRGPLDRDVASFSAQSKIKSSDNSALNKYTKYNTKISNGLLALRDMDLLVFKNFYGKNDLRCAWKMHIYANTEQDMLDLQNSVGKYLEDNGVTWKTTIDYSRLQYLSKDEQKGKALTIYPESIEDFKKIAKDVDYIIRNNGLQTQNSSISGDRQLGNTGRIFYRYDLKSGIWKDRIIDFDKEGDEYHKKMYEKNRQGNNYMASDMTVADDPFINFNPSANTGLRANRAGIGNLEDCPIEGNKYKLLKNKIFPLQSSIITFFESSDHIYDCKIDVTKDARIRCMRDGATLTIGRAEDNDIVIGKNNNRISRYHAKIYKFNNRLYIEDTSLNGTKVDR